jgi:hypothetical protein
MSRSVDEPRITGNAVLLAGFIGGLLIRPSVDSPYRPVEVDATDATTLLEHRNGNRYAITVRQISGVE